MNFPIPPTDNIYKFAALSGTIVLIMSVYLPILLVVELEERMLSLQLRTVETDADLVYFENKSNRLNSLIENSIERQKGERSDDVDKLSVFYSEDELKEFIQGPNSNARSPWQTNKTRSLLKTLSLC